MVSSPSSARGAARVALVVSLAGIALGALVAPSIPSTPSADVAVFPPGDTTVVYGPAQLSTPNGNATNHVERFALAVTPGMRYLLRIVNGAPNGSSKVTGGTVQLNGWETMTSADLASGATLERVVQVRTEDTLFVTVQGPAGAYVTASVLSTPDASFLVFGPEHFIRTTGTPVTETRTFSIGPTAAPPYRFCLVNGDIDGTNRVSSASIVLNGTEVFTQSQFNQNVSSLMTEVALQPANTLLVTLSGIPGGFVDLCVTATDTTPPVLTITAPPPNLITNDTVVVVSGSVADETPTTVTIDGAATAVNAGAFTDTVALTVEGPDTIHIVATDAAGHSTDSTRIVIRDRTAPVLTVNAPVNGFITNQASLPVSGTVTDANAVTVNVNGTPLQVSGSAFTGSYLLTEGTNVLVFTAIDAADNETPVIRTMKLDTQAPVIALTSPAEGDTIVADSATVVGTVTDVNPKTLAANGIAIPLGENGSFTGKVPLSVGPNTITLVATDSAMNNSVPFVRHVVRKNPLPPDPATVASALFRAEATLIKENTAFLYTAATPIQEGVTATIDTLRAAVVRGKVLDRTLQPLSGALVSIKGHPEFGHTTSRADGGYDLAVNGGGSLALDYSKGGYLPAQRTVEVPWQDYTVVEDVILIQPDTVVTVVDLTAPGITVARGSVQTDADSARQATVFFEEGTRAVLRHADGTVDTLTTLNVRATEFTVGENGEAAMPGELPPSSQYTYAVQVTADQQLAEAGATLTFTQPVPLYVENFLDLDSLKTVPVGVYDPGTSTWQPRPNGLMVKVLGTNAQGQALLDINGDGIADSDSLLLFNGMDPVERVTLAGTYPLNSRLWRVPIIEALPHDLNWPFTLLGGTEPKTRVTGPCGSEGADVLRCSLQAQTAFQSVGIVGSPFTLNYASDRTQGNVAERSLDIQLVGATVPAFLERVDLEITIAGRLFEASFTPTANLSYHFVWDGKDAYGRTVQATQPANVKVGYLYPVVYSKPAATAQSFGLPCNATTGSCTVAAVLPAETDVRALRRIWEGVQTTLGGIDAAGLGLGGFTLDVQHAYDPLGGILYNGDGTRRVAATLPDQITRWAGNGNSGGATPPVVNGKHRLAAQIDNPTGIVVAPDGSVIMSEPFRGRVLKVSLTDTISTLAGLPFGPIADSGTATALRIMGPQGIALGPDGSIYFAEQGGHRIRQVTPQGFMRTIAGDGTCGFAGDTGLAKAARVCQPTGLGVAPDGSIYFADQGNLRIRRIGPDRRISTVAGLGLATQCFLAGSGSWPPPPPQDFINICKDGGPASQAPLRLIGALTVGPDGSVYFGQGVGGKFDARIRRIDPSGIIRTVVGSDRGSPPVPLTNGDGGSALQARLASVWAIAIGPDGSIYFADEGPEQIVNGVPQPGTGQTRVRRVRPDGLIQTVVGDGVTGNTGDNGPARRARIQRVEGIAFLPDGSMLISDDAKVRKVSPPLPGLAGGQQVVASADGSELYVFSAAGRILQTLDAVTRDTIYTFGYNPSRQLISITDRDGRATLIERNAAGEPVATVTPTGQRTNITLDANGHIVGLTGPDGLPVGFKVDAAGMLTATVSQSGDTIARRAYDASGRLASLTNPLGGTATYDGQPTPTGANVVVQTPTGRSVTISYEELATGGSSVRSTMSGGMTQTTVVEPTGRTVMTAPNGTITTFVETPDPRFGMQAPRVDQTIQLPSGLTKTTQVRRGATLSDPNDPLSLLVQIDSVFVNGRLSRSRWDNTAHTVVTTSAAGRVVTHERDARGRITRTIVPGMPEFRETFDALGRPNTTSVGGRTITFGYDSLDRTTSATDEGGFIHRFAYDAEGHLIERRSPDGRVLAFDYDENGLVSSVTPPGRAAHELTYNTAGRLTRYTAPDVGSGPSVLSSVYDPAGRLISFRRPDSSVVTLVYDSASGSSTAILPDGDTLRVVRNGATGTVTEASVTHGAKYVNAYDGGLRTATTWSGAIQGTLSFGYDSDFRLKSMQVNSEPQIQRSFDNDGLLTSVGSLTFVRDPANGSLTSASIGSVTTSLSYTPGPELSALSARFGSDTILTAVMGRDSLGRIVARTERIAGVTTVSTFAYDSAGRLILVIRDGSPTESYEYDSNSNRTRATTVSGTVIGVVDAQDELISYGALQYTYTPNGERSRKIAGLDTTKYSYDVMGNLRSVDLPGGTHIDYVIDADGRRVATKVGGVIQRAWLYADQLAIVAELDAMGQVVSRFVYGDRANVPEYMIRGGNTYRIITDERGSVRLVVDVATGAIAQRLDYDAFGRVTLNSNPDFQPFGFSGGLFDNQTGLVHLGRREYDAEPGRWTVKDPIGFSGDDPNLYAYISNDPVNQSDISGLQGVIDFTIANGARNTVTSSAATGARVAFQIVRTASIVTPVAGAAAPSIASFAAPAFVYLAALGVAVAVYADEIPCDRETICEERWDEDYKWCSKNLKTARQRAICYGRAMLRRAKCVGGMEPWDKDMPRLWPFGPELVP